MAIDYEKITETLIKETKKNIQEKFTKEIKDKFPPDDTDLSIRRDDAIKILKVLLEEAITSRRNIQQRILNDIRKNKEVYFQNLKRIDELFVKYKKTHGEYETAQKEFNRAKDRYDSAENLNK